MILSRRKLLATTGSGVAAAGVIAAAPGIMGTRRGARNVKNHAAPITALNTSAPANHAASTGSTPTVAYVRDAAKGEVVLLIGTRQVVRRDPTLVAYLQRCCADA